VCPDLPENVWAPQVWGSWLEYAAGNRVALDSRIELFPTPLWDDADAIARGNPLWEGLLEKYGARYVVTQAGADQRLEDVLAASPNWERVYEDDEGSVWAKAPAPAISQ
jgi:hypothetical protein